MLGESLTPSASPAVSPVVSNQSIKDSSDSDIASPDLARVPSAKHDGGACRNLYSGLSLESKARKAVQNAFAKSPAKLLLEYTVSGIIGFGSNGVVLSAIPTTSNETSATDCNDSQVAIKIIYKYKVAAVAPLPSEIEVLQDLEKLRHPSIIRYIESWQDPYHHYLVTNLCGSNWARAADASATNGRHLTFTTVYKQIPRTLTLPISDGANDLFQWSISMRMLQYERSGETLLPAPAVKSIIRQVAAALQHLHAHGYYHGDIKTENIICERRAPTPKDLNSVASKPTDAYTAQPPHPRAVLADFGHARRAAAEAGGMKRYGTLKASAPEFLRESPHAAAARDGRRADVFALGIAAYILMSERGHEPAAVGAIARARASYWDVALACGGEFPFGAENDGVHALRDGYRLPLADDGFWSLVNGMCRVDPRQRFTIDEVLAHPWLN